MFHPLVFTGYLEDIEKAKRALAESMRLNIKRGDRIKWVARNLGCPDHISQPVTVKHVFGDFVHTENGCSIPAELIVEIERV